MWAIDMGGGKEFFANNEGCHANSLHDSRRRTCHSGEIKEILALDGDKFKPRTDYTKRRQGGNGFGLSFNNVGYTVTTIDRHMVGYVMRKK